MPDPRSLLHPRTPDSPRWCDHCKAWGDHHTDRHWIMAPPDPVTQRLVDRYYAGGERA